MSRTLASFLMVTLIGWGTCRIYAEDPPPPKMQRNYEGRVNLSQPSASEPAAPREKPKPNLPEVEGIPPPTQDPLARPVTRSPLIAPGPSQRALELDRAQRGVGAKEDQTTGWGWLADELAKSAQATNLEVQVDAEADEVDAQFSGKEDGLEHENMVEEFTFDRMAVTNLRGWTSGADQRKPVLMGLAGSTLDDNPGWLPVAADSAGPSDRGWNAAARQEPDVEQWDSTNQAGLSFEAPDPLGQLDRAREDAADQAQREQVLQRSQASNEQRIEPAGRSLFPRSEEAVSSAQANMPGASFRGQDAGAGFYATPSAALNSSIGLPGPEPSSTSFGSLGAMPLQPSLSTPTSLAPSMSLPSQSSGTLSLGGMGTGNEGPVRTKTLPW
jgi:hypothetical protein